MGIFSNLFGANPPVAQPPTLQSIFPAQARNLIVQGKLPTLQTDKLVLGQGEICHFVDVAAIVTEKTHYKSSRVGGSYHMWKGFTIHTGVSTSVPVTDIEYTKGILFFTNKRVVFVANKFGFEQKLNKLTAKSFYSDAAELQFGSKTYVLMLPDGNIAKSALALIV